MTSFPPSHIPALALSVDGLSPGAGLIVRAFTATERVSRPFRVDADAFFQEPTSAEARDPSTLLWRAASLSVVGAGGVSRFFSGIVTQIRFAEESRAGVGGSSGVPGIRVRLRVRPSLWRLCRRKGSRIFQELSAKEIVTTVLDEAKISHEWKLGGGSLRRRAYCVQHQESELDFVSRLLEEEGIYYFFHHEPGRHTLVLADSSKDSPPIPDGSSRLPFRPEGLDGGDEAIVELGATRRLVANAFVVNDFDFEAPGQSLLGEASAEGAHEPMRLELYEHPAGHAASKEAIKLARLRLEEARAGAVMLEGRSRCPRLAPGHRFTLESTGLRGADGDYFLVEVRHEGAQPDRVGTVSSGVTAPYAASFRAIPASVPHRPRRRTPKPVMAGAQNAIVVGPPGEEIYTDAWGRVKVKFAWDRRPGLPEDGSCWMRVVQAWAGNGWGALFIPRIGQEVIVDFEEGDPDRPIVIGSAYDGENVPPVALPKDKTRSALRSRSTPNAQGGNEISFEDAAGHEELFIHAERDLNVDVLNDKTQVIGHDESLMVHGNRRRTIQGDQTLSVRGSDESTIGAHQSVTVGVDRSLTVGAALTETIAGASSTVVGLARTLTVGGASAETVGLGKVVTIGGALVEAVGLRSVLTVGGSVTEGVGGSRMETIGGPKTETVGGNRELTVKADMRETVELSRTLKAKTLAIETKETFEQTVGQDLRIQAKTLMLVAEESFTIKSGSAEIKVAKDGSITIKGAKIEVTASGDLLLSGQKIGENG